MSVRRRSLHATPAKKFVGFDRDAGGFRPLPLHRIRATLQARADKRIRGRPMYCRTGAVFVARKRLMGVRIGASAFSVGLTVLAAAVACSSSQISKPKAAAPAQSGGTSSASGGSIRSRALRVVYHETFADSDPSSQTITLLSDGGSKFRVTFSPPGYEDFIVSDGVKEVDSIQGELEYAPMDQVHVFFRVRTVDLPKLCPAAKRAGRTAVLGRAADRYTCTPASSDDASELTIDSGSGLLLATKTATSTLAVTSFETNATIPAGSFDLPTVPGAVAPTEGLLNSKSPGVPDAQAAATAIEKCRADTNGTLPRAIPATKGPKVILRCGKATESFAVTPGNTVEYRPTGSQYSVTVTLPDGSMIDYASSKCPGAPICIDQ